MKELLKNKKIIILCSILLIIITPILGRLVKKNNILNFRASFGACMELEAGILYDEIMGTITKKEHAERYKEVGREYKKLKSIVPNELKGTYNDFLDAFSVITTNYGTYTKEHYDLVLDLKKEIIDVLNELSEKYNIDLEKVREKANKKNEQFEIEGKR